MCVLLSDGMLCNCTGVLTKSDLVVPRSQNSHPAPESGLGKVLYLQLMLPAASSLRGGLGRCCLGTVGFVLFAE